MSATSPAQAVTPAPRLWPGIVWGRTFMCMCPWGYGPDGVHQVRAVDPRCAVHASGLPRPASEVSGG